MAILVMTILRFIVGHLLRFSVEDWLVFFVIDPSVYISFFFFFFQAEDGIRDLTVNGVQTCALPISRRLRARRPRWAAPAPPGRPRPRAAPGRGRRAGGGPSAGPARCSPPAASEIGRASCRERGEISVGAVSFKKKKKINHRKRTREK